MKTEEKSKNELARLKFSNSIQLISDEDLKKKIEKVKAELEKINQKKEVDDDTLQIFISL